MRLSPGAVLLAGLLLVPTAVPAFAGPAPGPAAAAAGGVAGATARAVGDGAGPVPAPAGRTRAGGAAAGSAGSAAGSAGSALGSAGFAAGSAPGAVAARPVAPRIVTLALGSVRAPARGARVARVGGGPAVALSAPRTRGFDAVGVSWAGDAAVRTVAVRLRHRLGAGAWSAWSTVDGGDAEPDPGDRPAARGGTDPLWTGAADGVEVSVGAFGGAAPTDIRLTLIDPGTSPADDVAAPAYPSTVDIPAGTSAAVRPGIYSRAQWGADPKLMGWDPEYSTTIKAAFLHHTVNGNSYRPQDVPALLRAIYAYHSVTRDWGDIGYNFVIDRFGRIWEGRYGGIDRPVIGAHAGGFNTDTFGAAMLGTFDRVAPPPAVVEAAARLFAWKLATYYDDPRGTTRLTSSGGGTSRYPRGVTVTKAVISGHRDVGATDCPGRLGYAALVPIRARVTAIMGTGLVTPDVRPATVAYRSAAQPWVRALLWRPSAWTVTVVADCPRRVVRTYAGRGARIDLHWDLADSPRGSPAPARPARPGSYRILLTATAGATAAVPYGFRVTVGAPVSAPPAPIGVTPSPGPAGYVPVLPVRVLDTRTALGGGTTLPLTVGGRIDVPVVGVGAVPASGVAAVLLSGGATCPTGPNWLWAWPAGNARPLGAALTLGQGAAVPPTVVGVGIGGRISVSVYAGAMTDVVLEVVGYLPSARGSGYHPLVQTMVFDATVAPGEARVLDLRALAAGAVPVAATALSVNLAVRAPRVTGALRLWPDGATRPVGASLRFGPGRTQSARVLPGLPASGRLVLRNDGAAAQRVTIDLGGWFGPGGLSFTAVPRSRVFDAMVTGAAVAPVGPVPPAAVGVVAELTGYADRDTAVTAYPDGTRPPRPDLDLAPQVWTTNLVWVPIGADRCVHLFNAAGRARLVVDVLGYLTA
jgi:N-acetylmuramoyl-L-alanine amidase